MFAVALLSKPSAFFQQRPPSYPLPLTPDRVAYWNINAALCRAVPGWSDWQARKDMAEIIPVIECAMQSLTTTRPDASDRGENE
jgi:hypothetical protein